MDPEVSRTAAAAPAVSRTGPVLREAPGGTRPGQPPRVPYAPRLTMPPSPTFTLDRTGPQFMNVTALPREFDCTITWKTSEPATGQVEYGTTTAHGSASPLDTRLLTDHSVVLTGLQPKTL